MTLPTGSERDIEDAKQLLGEYSFDLSGFQPGELVAIWQERLNADPSWIRSAVLEALYQGRYKAFSVEQILQGWKRRGHPIRHFNSEFERIVLGPIDPTASKYAAMTSLRPSELMAPQPQRDATTATPTSSVSAPDETANAEPQASTMSEESCSSAPSPAESTQKTRRAYLDSSDAAAPADSPEIQDFVGLQSSVEAAPEIINPFSAFSQPEPIRRFIPQSEASRFYHRLQSVARHFT